MNIAADDKCLIQFQNLKYRKIEARYIVFTIDKQQIVVERIGNKEQKWGDFITSLPDNDYRYAVFDFEFTNSDNMSISKLIFLAWNPDSAPLKKRILYATAKQNFKKYLDMNTKDYTMGSKGDLTEQDIIKELSH